jgi:hypothetical protein
MNPHTLTFSFHVDGDGRLHPFDCSVLLNKVAEVLWSHPHVRGRFDAKLVPDDGMSGMAQFFGWHDPAETGDVVDAAAPELLAALRKAVSLLSYAAQGGGLAGCNADEWFAIESDLNSAINKAEGRSE